MNSRWRLLYLLGPMLLSIGIFVRRWDQIAPVWPQLLVLMTLLMTGVILLARRIAQHEAEEKAQ